MATKTKTAEAAFAVGTAVLFAQYAEGGSGAFKKGEKLTVTAVIEATTPEEIQYTVENAAGVKENLFVDEIKAAKSEAKAPAKTLAKPKQKAAAPAKTGLKAPPKAKVAKVAKPAKAKAEKPAKQEPEIEPITLTASVAEMVGTPKEALDAAQSLLASIGMNYYSLGGVLAYIQQTSAFVEAGYETFRDYAEQELGQKQGKVYMLMGIYRAFSAAGVDDERVKTVGWTFARDMAKYINGDNVDQMFKQAKKLSREELSNWLLETYATDAEKAKAKDKIVKQSYTFKLHGDQAKQVEKAMKHALKTLDTDDANAAFFHIVTAYQQSQMQNSLTLEQEIEFIENTHGVKLEVVKPASAKVDATKAPAKAAKVKA